MNKNTLQVLGILFLVVMLPVVVVGVRLASDIRSGASAGEEPREIVVSNLTDNTATISWITTDEVAGIVKYGTDPTGLSIAASDSRDEGAPGSYRTHHVKLRNLSPETQYYFEITSGGSTFSGSNSYNFTTLPTSDSLSVPESIIGSVTPAVSDAILYAHASDGNSTSTPISVHISSSNFAIVKQNFKDRTTGEPYDLSNTRILISVTNSDGQRGQAIINGDENRSPDISLSSNTPEYDPTQVLEAQNVNPTRPQTTQTPSITSAPIPTTGGNTPLPGNINTEELVTSKVSYGQEVNDPTVPYSIFISNISPSGFCVNWLTKVATVGRISYFRENGSQEITSRDVRDQSDIERFTHIACVSQPNFTSGERISFYIHSNGQTYGESLTSRRFVFPITDATDVPPSPGTIEGNLTVLFPSLVTQKQDFLVSARYESTTSSNSSWVSSTVLQNFNWSLPYASILDTNLNEYYDVSSANSYHIEAHGEFNSYSDADTSTDSEIITMPIQVGLSILNPPHNSTQPGRVTLYGTATPNTQVKLSVNSQPLTVNTDSTGRWQNEITLNGIGAYVVEAQSISGDRMALTFQTSDIDGDGLPDTALKDWIPYIVAAILITLGLGLTVKLRSYKEYKE